jgi:two-component system KDP operon response regulator KdpE
MQKLKILIIDDEPQICKMLTIILESNDYQVIVGNTAKEGLLLAASHQPDLILLDLGLPDKNGQELLKDLLLWYTKAIIILSAQHSENEIIAALDNGAEDYLTKPFRTGELLARIRLAIRKIVTDSQTSPILQFDNLSIDLTTHTIKKRNEVLKLTATEYDLLTILAKNEGKILTHQYLLKQVWGLPYSAETQYVRVFIAQLRKKIEDNPSKPRYLLTESGIGYRFVG